MFEKLQRRKYEKEASAENEMFTAHIIRGNRQVIERRVYASKRFIVDGETYIIRPECIFLKNIDGMLTSVAYYREGNPNPYDFESENTGINSIELDRLFAEDFYTIITNLEPEEKMRLMLVLALINMVIGSLALVMGIIGGKIL
jgi:hypothetical protein